MKKNLILAMVGAAALLVPMVSCQKSADKTTETTTETTTQPETATEATDSVAELFKAGVDKYPRDVDFMENAALKARLVALIGQERYDYLAENFNTQTPIEEKDGLYTAHACQAHNCEATNFTIVYDAKSNVLSVIYRVDGKDETFTEK